MSQLNWAGSHRYTSASFHEPSTVTELVDLVGSSEQVRVIASRHCFNDISDTEGSLISLRGLPDVVEVHDDTVSVTPWTLYGVLGEQLHAAGRALPTMASLPHISVGGAIATGTHGSGDGVGCLATPVVSLDVLRADGSITTIHRGEPDFDGQVVALGALGVWTRVELATVSTYDVAQVVWTGLPWATVLDRYDELTAAAYSVSVFTDLSGAPAQAWTKARVDAPADLTPYGAARADVPMHMLEGGDGTTATEQLEQPGPWHVRLPHFRPEFTPSRGRELQSEYLLPRARVREALEVLTGLRPQLGGLLQMAELRTVAADRLWLSPAYDADVVGVHFTWVQDEPAVRAVLEPIEAGLLPLGARPHWGKVFVADAAALEPLYPRYADFRALRDRQDPERVFGNGYLDRVLGG